MLFLLLFFELMYEYPFRRYFSSYVVGVSVYAMVLLPLLPALRSRFSARCCGVLWFLPSGFYYANMIFNEFRKPLMVIPIPEAWFYTLCDVWLWGILLIIAWNIISHLLFRRRVMEYAEPVREQWILNIWEGEKLRVLPRNLDTELVISFEVLSPVSIGVFQGTTVVALPKRTYTAEELRLIFRHELIHISRQDGMNKFYLLFATAMCWFNPLVWLMKRKAAEDLERSCDESVLLEASEDTRRQYAELVLGAAGEQRGFTSCLAASASSMRYRLKSIVKGKAKRSGALLVIVLCLAIAASTGTVALAYDCSTVETVVQERGGGAVTSASMPGGRQCTDLAALEQMLTDVKLCRIAGSGTDWSDKLATVELENRVFLSLRRDTVTVYGGGEKITYYLPESMDWEAFEALFR